MLYTSQRTSGYIWYNGFLTAIALYAQFEDLADPVLRMVMIHP
jgi:hypothetical protein